MAAAIAYEQPSIERSWQAFLSHLPTLLIVLVLSLALSLVGYGVALVVQILVTALLDTAALDASGAASSLLVVLLANLAQLPFLVLSSVVGILFTAIPALHYETGETISVETALAVLLRRPARYILAGLLFSVAATIGFLLCILPGIVISLILPVYVNRIFNGDASIIDSFTGSFQAVYGSEHGFTFIGIQLLAMLVTIILTICTCGLGGLVAGPMASFYIQNSAYRQGVLR
jgi:hypothetical protein